MQTNLFAISLEYESAGSAGSTPMDDRLQALPSVFAAHRFSDRPIAIGFGTYAPFALSSDWGRNAAFTRPSDPFNPLDPAHRIPYAADLAYVKHHVALAWQATDRLALAAGLSHDAAELEMETAARFDGSGDAIGFSLSALWQPSAKHSFGLNYQARTEATLEGDAHIRIPLTHTIPSSTRIVFPESIVCGCSYRPTNGGILS